MLWDVQVNFRLYESNSSEEDLKWEAKDFQIIRIQLLIEAMLVDNMGKTSM